MFENKDESVTLKSFQASHRSVPGAVFFWTERSGFSDGFDQDVG